MRLFMFLEDLNSKKEKFSEDFKFGQRRFFLLGFVLTLFFLTLIYLGPLEGLMRLGLVVEKKSEQSSLAATLPAKWVGVNSWGLAAAEDAYDCGGSSATHQQTLDSTFSHLKDSGVSVVRFFAFQSYAIGPDGQRNWTALDRVFNSASTQGIYLIPVLGNNWNDCDYWPLSRYGESVSWPQKWYNGWYRSASTVEIASSTNTSPIKITTKTPHGFLNNGWRVTVQGHDQGNANRALWG